MRSGKIAIQMKSESTQEGAFDSVVCLAIGQQHPLFGADDTQRRGVAVDGAFHMQIRSAMARALHIGAWREHTRTLCRRGDTGVNLSNLWTAGVGARTGT